MTAMVELILILFLVVVAPIWLVLHYRSKRPPDAAVAGDGDCGDLWQTARRMEERIRTLERILDADAPTWRGRR